MSVRGTVGPWEFVWTTVPRGPSGQAQVEVRRKGAPAGSPSTRLEIRWRRDGDGIWLELPSGVHGFDIQGESGDEGRPVFQLSERGNERFWQGQAYFRAGEEALSAGSSAIKKSARIRAQMPGKILRVNVAVGARAEKGQSLLVMEAMKMENEIRAPQAGIVEQIKVVEGQAVETGADLCLIKTE